jgi:hypothetical protein
MKNLQYDYSLFLIDQILHEFSKELSDFDLLSYTYN